MGRMRLRDLGITIGTLPTGPYNAITDVPGVWVGHSTVIHDEPQVVRTGITVVVPREEAIREDFAFAGFHSFNGCGEITGVPWLEESGMLSSPIALTNTNHVGLVRDGLSQYARVKYQGRGFWLSVVAET
jgi:D-aminopeptidase